MKHLVRIVIVLLVISWAWRYGRETFNRWVERTSRVDFSTPATPTAAASFFGFPSGEHFSPGENLEWLDYEVIRRAHHSIDIAMCALTDRVLASAVIAAAQRGVQVHIFC